MPFTEDLDIFLADFGVTVNVTSGVGAPFTFTGIYDNGYAGIALGEVEMEGTDPQVQCKSADIASMANGDALTVNSINYTVNNIRPDGTGWTFIELHEA